MILRRLAPLVAVFFFACGAPPLESASPVEPIARAGQALTTCVVVQRGQASPWGTVTDAEIRSATPTANYGGGTNATIGLYSGAARQTLARWDLSAIPSNATVTSATATLTNNYATTSATASAYAMGATWAEGGVTWTSAGGAIGGSTLASATNPGTAGATFALDLTTAAQAWVTVPTSNNGVALDEGSAAGNLVTSEGTAATQRPKLSVCYTLPSQCGDGSKDGAETDVDCGGGTCSPCANGLTCIAPADCASGTCAGTTCAVAPGQSIAPVTSCAFPSPLPPLVTGIDLQYGTDAREILTLWIPPGTPPANGWPLNVDVPGGGGNASAGRLQSGMTFHAQVLTAQGIASISIDYPLFSGSAPNVVNAFPSQLNSMRTLACYLQSIAATYALDMSRVAWSGYSYGAQLTGHLIADRNTNTLAHGTVLAAPTCSLANVAKVSLVYYGNTNMAHDVTGSPAWWSAANPNEWQMLNVTGPTDPLTAGRAADATVQMHTGDPPLLLLDGASDAVVAPAMVSAFLAMAQGVGVASTWISLPGVGHGFSPFYTGTAYTVSNCTSDAFLMAPWL